WRTDEPLPRAAAIGIAARLPASGLDQKGIGLIVGSGEAICIRDKGCALPLKHDRVAGNKVTRNSVHYRHPWESRDPATNAVHRFSIPAFAGNDELCRASLGE